VHACFSNKLKFYQVMMDKFLFNYRKIGYFWLISKHNYLNVM